MSQFIFPSREMMDLEKEVRKFFLNLGVPQQHVERMRAGAVLKPKVQITVYLHDDMQRSFYDPETEMIILQNMSKCDLPKDFTHKVIFRYKNHSHYFL